MKDLLLLLSENWLSLALLCTAAPFYAYCALHDEGKLKGWGSLSGFFGKFQYRRKYNDDLDPPPNNWYYRFFKLPYKERFTLSATLLAWTTDGYHSFQLVWKSLVIASVAILTPWPWTFFITAFSLFTFIFALFYKLLSR